jgi:hypothetical protein
MPFETVEGELKALVHRGGHGAKIRARCAKGSQIGVSANACGGGVVYSRHYIMTGFRVANSAQHPWKLQYNFMIVPTEPRKKIWALLGLPRSRLSLPK